MKLRLTLLFFLTFLTIHSQTDNDKKKVTLTKKELFKKQLDSVVLNYKGNSGKKKGIVQGKLLNERLTEAFNQVIFGNSDLVDNASAFGYSQNKEKTNISVSTNFHLHGKSKRQWYLKAGINANGSGNVFNLYSNDEWKNSVGGSIGLIFKFKGSGITNEGINMLQQNKVLRKIFIRDSIMSSILSLNKDSYKRDLENYLDALKKENKEEITKCSKDLKAMESAFKKAEKYRPKKKNEKLDFSDYSDKIQNEVNYAIIEEIINIIWKDTKKDDNPLRTIIKDVAYEYDKKNIKNTGYSFWWIDANLSLNNNTFNFSEKAKNIKSDVLTDFNMIPDKIKTDINKLSTVLSANLNYSNNYKEGALYIQGGVKFNSGSFLNSNLINGTAKVSKFENDLFIIEDEDEKSLGDFNSIKESLKYGSLDLYGAYFFGKKKVFGLNLALSHKYKIKVPTSTFYENNYSVLFGPVFRKPDKDKNTGLTFGIDVGVDNALYSKKAKDNFVARIRVGIPFKLFNINK